MYSTNKKHVYTNGCHFVDSTGGGSFELKQDSGNRLYLVQHEKYPLEGTLISIK
jgi:hypothetical protein